MIVGAAEAVAHARRRVGAHAAAAAGMIEVVAFAGVHDPTVARFCERPEHVEHVRFRRRLPGHGRFVETMLDLRHRIAVAVFLRGIEGETAVRRRMHVNVSPQPHRTALRARTPVGHQLVSQQQGSIGRTQAWIAASRAFPPPHRRGHRRPLAQGHRAGQPAGRIDWRPQRGHHRPVAGGD